MPSAIILATLPTNTWNECLKNRLVLKKGKLMKSHDSIYT
jgi:hypothetical protein